MFQMFPVIHLPSSPAAFTYNFFLRNSHFSSERVPGLSESLEYYGKALDDFIAGCLGLGSIVSLGLVGTKL